MESPTNLELQPQLGERVAKLIDFTNTGVDLIKNADYENAIRHFGNHKFAKEVGIKTGDSKAIFLRKDLTDPIEIQDVLDFISLHSHFNHRDSEVVIASLINSKLDEGNTKYFVSQDVWKDISLVNLEEWLHAIQYISKKPLAGEEDTEIDVALYMKSKGIPLTDHFLSMHGRKKYI